MINFDGIKPTQRALSKGFESNQIKANLYHLSNEVLNWAVEL